MNLKLVVKRFFFKHIAFIFIYLCTLYKAGIVKRDIIILPCRKPYNLICHKIRLNNEFKRVRNMTSYFQQVNLGLFFEQKTIRNQTLVTRRIRVNRGV